MADVECIKKLAVVHDLFKNKNKEEIEHQLKKYVNIEIIKVEFLKQKAVN